MAAIASVPGLKNHLQALPKEVRDYFQYLPGLLDAFPLEVSLAYVFHRVEMAHNMMFYCGVVKRHRADAAVARKAVNLHRLETRDFPKVFKLIFGAPLPEDALKILRAARQARNSVMHGKGAEPREMRQAIAGALDWAVDLNAHVYELAGFRPFGPLKGFKGRATSADDSTTREILKALGFRAI